MATLQEEIGRLIARRLLAGEAITIPEVGTLLVERRPARRLSASMIQPPSRSLVFHFAEEGAPLPDLIARELSCPLEEARDAVVRWLEKSRGEGGLTIDGVGGLQGKIFAVEADFQRRLNPQGSAPIRLERSMPWWAWSLITVLLVALMTGGLVWWINPLSWWQKQEGRGQVAEVAEVVEMEAEPLELPDTLEVATPEPQPEEPNYLVKELHRPESMVRTRSGMSYLVLGIYSTEENARRAMAEAEAKYSLLPGESCLLFYGQKYLLSLGECESREVAKTYASRYRNERGIEEVWVYSK